LERWVQFGFIAIALLSMWLLGHVIEAIWFVFAEPDDTLITATALVVSGAGALIAYRHPKAHRFANEVAAELSMVTWPSRQETWTNTVVVIVTSVIAASILGVFDAAWSTVTDLIYAF
jgi:preprotein translocase subunit SecE